MPSKPPGLSPKTSLGGLPPATTPSDASWERSWERIPHSTYHNADGGVVRVLSMDRQDAPRGGSWTRRAGSPSGEGAFLWSMHGLVLGEIPLACFSKPKSKVRSILQRDGVEARYFLTPKACAGILSRASRRGKTLPALLEAALSAVARGAPADGTLAFREAPTSSNEALIEAPRAPSRPIEEVLAVDPLVFDNTQVTSVLNFSNPKPGDPVHPLTHYGQPPYLAFMETDISALADANETWAFNSKRDGHDASDIAPTLVAAGHVDSHANGGAPPAVCWTDHVVASDAPLDDAVYQEAQYGVERYDTAGTLRAGRIPEHQQVITGGAVQAVRRTMRVRRLTPLECLRLQGFPDDYLDGVRVRGKPLGEGARYRMAGNSWAVPVIAWAFLRLDATNCERLAEPADKDHLTDTDEKAA